MVVTKQYIEDWNAHQSARAENIGLVMTRVEIEGQGGELGELGCFNLIIPILTLTSPKPKAVVIPGSGTQLPAPQTQPVPSGLGLCALSSIRLPGSN